MNPSETLRSDCVAAIKNGKTAEDIKEALNLYLNEIMQDAHSLWFNNKFKNENEKAYCLGAMRAYSLISAVLNGRLAEYEQYLKNPPEEFDGRIERLWDDDNVFNWQTVN